MESELGRSEQLDSCLLWDSVGVCPPPARQARWRWARSWACGSHSSDRPHIRPLGTEPVPPERRHTKTDTPAVHRIDHPYDMKSRSWWPPLVYSSCFHPDSPRTLFELRRAPGVVRSTAPIRDACIQRGHVQAISFVPLPPPPRLPPMYDLHLSSGQ